MREEQVVGLWQVPGPAWRGQEKSTGKEKDYAYGPASTYWDGQETGTKQCPKEKSCKGGNRTHVVPKQKIFQECQGKKGGKKTSNGGEKKEFSVTLREETPTKRGRGRKSQRKLLITPDVKVQGGTCIVEGGC